MTLDVVAAEVIVAFDVADELEVAETVESFEVLEVLETGEAATEVLVILDDAVVKLEIEEA